MASKDVNARLQRVEDKIDELGSKFDRLLAALEGKVEDSSSKLVGKLRKEVEECRKRAQAGDEPGDPSAQKQATGQMPEDKAEECRKLAGAGDEPGGPSVQKQATGQMPEDKAEECRKLAEAGDEPGGPSAQKQATGQMPEDDPLTSRVGRARPHIYPGFSAESARRAEEDRAEPGDVFVTTAPKTGTTWLQAICHFLRTQGRHDDFQDIYQVCPWDQMAWDLGQDLRAEPVARPRVFKTHLPLSTVCRGGRHLCVVRDVEKSALSLWRFLCDKKAPDVQKYSSASEFVFDKDFLQEGMGFGATIWQYYVEFFRCLDLPNVLVLAFEDLEADLRSHLPLIADFLGVEQPDEDALGRVLSLCSKEGMAKMSSRYDESWAYDELRRLGRSPNEAAPFTPALRVHLTPSKEQLGEEAREMLRSRWAEDVCKPTGLEDYAALRRAIRTELDRRRAGVEAPERAVGG